MQKLKFIAIPTNEARALQRGEPDANEQTPERLSSGGGPCRHCLKPVEQHEPMLVLGYRPFDQAQPYAEVGPIFLHARECERYSTTNTPPAMFTAWRDAPVIVRGYGEDNRIQYDSAKLVPATELQACCRSIFENTEIAYIHIRAGQTNCFQCRVERG